MSDREKPLSEEPYEEMFKVLYDYYFGRIGFLDLLSKFEEILHIKSPQTEHCKSDAAATL